MPNFSTKDPNEVIVLSFSYINILDVGETITACTFTSTDQMGAADASTSMISGLADISASPIVKQEVIAGKDGHDYLIRSQATTSNGRVLVGSAVLPVKAGA